MSAICGMIGSFAMQSTAEADLSAMLEALAFRAPDGAATWHDPEGGASLGFRWLRTEPGERSPGIQTRDGSPLVMTCDGHVFTEQGASTEPLLERFAAQGADGLRDLDAQFALAVWDRKRRRLTLARDPLGVRFVYYFCSGDGAIFASEIKALLKHPAVPRAFDETALVHYLTFLNVPGPRTLFSSIARVPAGSSVTLSVDGRSETRRYWDLLDSPIEERNDEAFYVDRTRELHHGAVRRRAVRGPVGALLSGGNDSSANVSLLARLSRGDTGALHTFTVGLAEFEGDAKYNDLYYARQVATQAGTKHHDALLSTDDFLALIPETVAAQDDLVSEPSSIFLYHALRMAKDQGVRVVVTGEANDELCCGHGGMVQIRDGHAARWQRFLRTPRPVRQAAAMLAPLFAPGRHDVLQRAADDGEYFWSYEIAWPESELPALVPQDLLHRCRAELPSTIVARNRRRVDASAHGKRDYLDYMIYSMMQDNYFGNLMLSKLDLLSSRLALEPRCPYTEPAYAHWVYNVPASLKWKDGWVKFFFKKSIEGVLANDIIYRPKQGFRTPAQELFAGRLGEWARPVLLETGFTRMRILDRDVLSGLLERHRRRERDYSTKLWTAMMLNLWCEQWMR